MADRPFSASLICKWWSLIEYEKNKFNISNHKLEVGAIQKSWAIMWKTLLLKMQNCERRAAIVGMHLSNSPHPPYIIYIFLKFIYWDVNMFINFFWWSFYFIRKLEEIFFTIRFCNELCNWLVLMDIYS